MSLFGQIMSKIFHHPAAQGAAPASASAPATAAAPPQAQAQAQPAAAPPSQLQPDHSAPDQSVDVGAVLQAMAQDAPDGGGNYQSSIVDLLKLLGLDSSLQPRKSLADELGVHVAADGSAEENIALHRAVMQKLQENGGRVPDALKAA